MKDNLAIKVEGLGKSFKLGKNQFWALKDVSFKVKKGEVLGVIGPNGVGKSTLLKILGQVVRPSAGKATMIGNVTSILDIGAGFHPELSGKENIFMKGQLMGLKRAEILKFIGEIHDFSGIGAFMDQPVKNYSDGMFLRLAFSIFVFLKPEILLLDEVFNVGDKAFQKKSTNKIKEIIRGGATVLLVSHNMEEITEICDQCLLLEEGRVVMKDTARNVVEHYMENVLTQIKQESMARSEGQIGEAIKVYKWSAHNKPDNGVIQIQKIGIRANGKSFQDPIFMSDNILVEFFYEKITPEGSVEWVINIYDMKGSRLITDCNGFRADYNPVEKPPGMYQDTVVIPGNLLNHGIFSLEVTLSKNYDDLSNFMTLDMLIPFKVQLNDWDKENAWSQMINSSLRPLLVWESKSID
ncbi:MAG: ABC transporter ATP-binding protein [Bacteroidota bacterium]